VAVRKARGSVIRENLRDGSHFVRSVMDV